jgi:putative membrane protein
VRGPLFIGVTVAVVLWLWWSGNLSLYIHPRYHVFTAVMAVIAVVALVLFAAIGVARAKTDHDHEHEQKATAAEWVSTAIAAVALIALVALPPATLTTQTVDNRSINQSGLGDASAVFDEATVGQSDTFASFTVREWAAILSQTSDPSFYAGKPVDVIGFVSEDPEDSEQFFLTRFVVSCCSVDAQPVGVPVRLPGWRELYAEEQWLSISGQFVLNPSGESTEPIVLSPANVEPTERPNEPYLF